MYSFGEEMVIEGDIEAVWQAATDVASWPSWDPHEQKARLDGPFTPGTKGWNKPRGAPAGTFTLVDVDPRRMWSARAGIPFGSLRGVNRYEPLGDGRVRVSKVFEVHGPFGPIFRLIWEKAVRSDMRLTFEALQAEARRRAAAGG
ncbi:SRPBCC family protein [Actinoplanes subtropicus]|uniref:SRPBCC family protein n=1 Tax=Actinoplanes subtropicus TaxID=543632 RepID=UPI0004C363D1|nr:SRPBCC family protein [Actinoplanes subtropicus]